jgi:hypothetical protein
MSSSPPRKSHSSRSKASAPPRKRTQEIATGDGFQRADEGGLQDALEPRRSGAVASSDLPTAVELASSALDAADQPLRDPDSTPTPEQAASEQSFAPETEASPLGRAILGAEDMSGDWRGKMPAAPGSAPSTPLEMLQETDLLAERAAEDAEAASGEPARAHNSSGVLGTGLSFASTPMPDEEFLRRVVLPPLSQQPLAGAPPPPALYEEEDFQDKTVISEPPSPEMVASWKRPSRATGWSFRRKLSRPVEVTTLELIGLCAGAALGGGIIGALFFAVPTSGADGPLRTPAALIAPGPASARTDQAPIVTPLVPRPTVESLPSPEERAAEGDPSASSRWSGDADRRATSTTRRGGSSGRKPSKKEWVDPFE